MNYSLTCYQQKLIFSPTLFVNYVYSKQSTICYIILILHTSMDNIVPSFKKNTYFFVSHPLTIDTINLDCG